MWQFESGVLGDDADYFGCVLHPQISEHGSDLECTGYGQEGAKIL